MLVIRVNRKLRPKLYASSAGDVGCSAPGGSTARLRLKHERARNWKLSPRLAWTSVRSDASEGLSLPVPKAVEEKAVWPS